MNGFIALAIGLFAFLFSMWVSAAVFRIDRDGPTILKPVQKILVLLVILFIWPIIWGIAIFVAKSALKTEGIILGGFWAVFYIALAVGTTFVQLREL